MSYDLFAFHIYRGERLSDDEKPLMKNTPDLDSHRPSDAAPYIVVVQGPPNVGKSLLIKSLLANSCFSGDFGDRLTSSYATTVRSGKPISLKFVECPNDINGMIDAAKYADVAILMVDASYGFEMETFEFRNLLQVHGLTKVIGVLTHLANVDIDEQSEVKQRLEDHFCTEICEGAKVFSLSGLHEDVGGYETSDMDDLLEVLSDSKFLPSSWRAEHPYFLVDECVDVTPEREHGDKQFNRNLSLHGYLRGCDIKEGGVEVLQGKKVHIAGAGDFSLAGVTRSFDPCQSEDGLKAGTYLCLHVSDVPPEMVEKVDPRYPILVGVVPPEVQNCGFMQVKLRRHSWHPDLLMTGAPITVSAGWRRYQTTTIYAMDNENGQHQLLNYTPENKDCLAVFWGPLAPPNTKIVAVQDKSYCLTNKKAFQIIAKGVVLDFNHDARILLKVESMGTVHISHPSGKTAHIEFAPDLKHKTDKFIGAPIQTKSGVRGNIVEAAGEGIVKCTFEDNVDMSDSFLFPVLAKFMLPSLFKQLNLLFKPLKIPVDSSAKATIAATFTALDSTIAATFAAAIDAKIIVEDDLAVSYQEVDPKREMSDTRRSVAIHEGKRQYGFFPNQLESFYSSLEKKNKNAVEEKKKKMEEWVAEINKRKFCFGMEYFPQVVRHIPTENTATQMVIDYDKEVRPGESMIDYHLRKYGKQAPHS